MKNVACVKLGFPEMLRSFWLQVQEGIELWGWRIRGVHGCLA